MTSWSAEKKFKLRQQEKRNVFENSFQFVHINLKTLISSVFIPGIFLNPVSTLVPFTLSSPCTVGTDLKQLLWVQLVDTMAVNQEGAGAPGRACTSIGSSTLWGKDRLKLDGWGANGVSRQIWYTLFLNQTSESRPLCWLQLSKGDKKRFLENYFLWTSNSHRIPEGSHLLLWVFF